MVSGRLGGTDIARTEWSKEGRIPLQTLRADVDYGFAEAHTMVGLVGTKVWIFRGELEPGQWSPPNIKIQQERGQDGARRERADQEKLMVKSGSGRRSKKARLGYMLQPKRKNLENKCVGG